MEGVLWGFGDQTQDPRMQGKPPPNCTLSPVSDRAFHLITWVSNPDLWKTRAELIWEAAQNQKGDDLFPHYDTWKVLEGQISIPVQET